MTELSLDSLDARLRHLEDIQDIKTLRMLYHRYINEEQFGQVVSLYTPDARLDFGPIAKAQGTAQIDAMYRSLPDNVEIVKQFIHNHLVEVHGDEAVGLAYLDARYGNKGESLLVGARFEEKYRRTAEGWRISETIVRVWFAAPVEPGWMIADNSRIQPWK